MKKILLSILALVASSAAHAQSMRGMLIIAADGEFLGTCDGEFGTNSIANKFSQYGNEFNSKSMFNKFGPYSSEFGRYSAFNDMAWDPPYIIAPDRDLERTLSSYSYRPSEALKLSAAYRVTANDTFVKNIHPLVLREVCKNL